MAFLLPLVEDLLPQLGKLAFEKLLPAALKNATHLDEATFQNIIKGVFEIYKKGPQTFSAEHQKLEAEHKKDPNNKEVELKLKAFEVVIHADNIVHGKLHGGVKEDEKANVDLHKAAAQAHAHAATAHAQAASAHVAVHAAA